MNELTEYILVGLTVAVAIAAVIIIIVTSQQSRGRGRKLDLGLLLGISWLVAGAASLNYVVGILGLLLLVYCLVKKR